MQADDVNQTTNTRNAPKNENENIPVRNIKDLGIKKKRTAAIESISIILLHPLDKCFN